MAPLFSTIPVLIPRDIHSRDEVVTFDAVCAGVRKHRLVEGGSFGVPHSARALVGGREYHAAALASQDQVALWVGSEEILGLLILGDHMPGNELPYADKRI